MERIEGKITIFSNGEVYISLHNFSFSLGYLDSTKQFLEEQIDILKEKERFSDEVCNHI